MAKEYKGFRFDAGTLREIDTLKKAYNIENTTLLIETLISEAAEKINKEKNTGLTTTEVINLYNERNIYFENREGKFFINGKIFSPQMAYSFMRNRMGEMNLHHTMLREEYEKFSKKTIRNIIEYYVPGHTENWDSTFK